MKRILTTLTVLAGGIFLSQSAFATSSFVITPTFTANFNTNFGANAVAAQNAWIAAAAIFTSNFSDNIHVNITVDAVGGTGVFGQSSTFLNSTSFANLQNLFVGDAKSTDDNTALNNGGSMFGADPVSGTHTWWVSRAEAKALGLIASDGVTDGTTTFGAGNPFTFNGPIAGGTFDFKGVAAHEISEVMGRLGISGGTIGSNPNSYSLIDLFSYRSAGTRVLTNGGASGPGSFSVNAGTNLLAQFNDAFHNGLDTRDLAVAGNDSFNQFENSGVANPVTAVDLRIMDVLGYDLITTPEPGTISLFALGLAALVGSRFKRRSR